MSNSTSMRPHVIILAAGQGRRFLASGGIGSKLHTRLGDRTVLEHTLAAVQRTGLSWRLVDEGYPGMGDSIAAGVNATPNACGWLILPGDLPLVKSDSLIKVANALAEHAAVVPLHKNRRGHPVGFNASCGSTLRALDGEQGASKVLEGLLKKGLALEMELADPGIWQDIDTMQDLRRCQHLLHRELARDEGLPNGF